MPEDDANRLRRHAEDALGGAYDPSRVLPILHRLAKHAEVGSDDALFAHLRLAELLVARSPWRASIHARKVLALHPREDRAWAILGLSQALLGHYRFARTAYEAAVRAAPENPFYAHNLGHLIDVALDAPREALVWLRRASELAPNHPDVLASLAHAHARLGDFAEARSLLEPLRPLLGRGGRAADRRAGTTARSELARLIRWVDREAPEATSAAPASVRPRMSPRSPTGPTRARATSTGSPVRTKLDVRTRGAKTKAVLEILVGGLAHLPLSARQLARARALAKHVRARVELQRTEQHGPPALGSAAGLAYSLADVDRPALAAAIAYAIVYVDQVPLSAGEVAAPFRVSATRVRAAFEVLRSELDLIRGDARYATEAR